MDSDAMDVGIPPPVTCETLTGANGTPLIWSGPPLSAGPRPTFFYLALSGKESLCLDPFNQPVAFSVNSGIRCFSLDLPGHGEGFDKMKAMAYWAEQTTAGATPVEDISAEVAAQVNYLVDNGIALPGAIAAGGLSRGGLIASHAAAQCDHIQHLLLYSPLTSLSRLEEFGGKAVAHLDIEAIADRLTTRNIKTFISTNDTRVSTDACYDAIRKIVLTAIEQRTRSPQVELTLYPPIGHKGHGTPPHVFHAGVQWLKQQLTPEDTL